MTKLKIFDRLTRRPSIKGQTFKQKSRTIPGQDLTPQEIMRMYTQKRGSVNNWIYSQADLHSVTKMNEMDRHDFLEKMRLKTGRSLQEIKEILSDLKTPGQTQETTGQAPPKKPPTKTTTTTNDDDE